MAKRSKAPKTPSQTQTGIEGLHMSVWFYQFYPLSSSTKYVQHMLWAALVGQSTRRPSFGFFPDHIKHGIDQLGSLGVVPLGLGRAPQVTGPEVRTRHCEVGPALRNGTTVHPNKEHPDIRYGMLRIVPKEPLYTVPSLPVVSMAALDGTISHAILHEICLSTARSAMRLAILTQ